MPCENAPIIVNFVGSRTTASIGRVIVLYQPDSLMIGSRGRSVLQQYLGSRTWSSRHARYIQVSYIDVW